MGANGAGKSTLVKILCGAYGADAGSIVVGGRALLAASPRQARAHGVIAVHQTIADTGVPTLSVADNLLLDRYCASNDLLFAAGRSKYRAARKIAEGIRLDIDLKRQLGSLVCVLGPLGRDLLDGQLVLDPGRVKLADELALRHLHVGGKDRENRGLAWNQVVVVIAERSDHLASIGMVIGRRRKPVVIPTIAGMHGRDLRSGGEYSAGDQDDGGDGFELSPEHGL